MRNRRDFLKASLVGSAALAINPYLTAAPTASQNMPKRFIFIRRSNGIKNTRYTLPNLPANLLEKNKKLEPFEVALDKYELPEMLKGLNEYKEHMTIIQGMTNNMSGLGHGSKHSIMGLFKPNKGALSALIRTTVDYELAKLFPSPLGHVELSFAGSRRGIIPGYCVPSPNTKNFAYADAITAYNNLFKCVLNPKLLNSENGKLDHLADQIARQTSGMKANIKGGHDKYIMAMKALTDRNANLAKMASQIAKKLPNREKIYKLGHPDNSIFQRQDAMTDVLISAMTSRMTNVVTYTIDDLDTIHTNLPGISASIHLHGVGHNKTYSGVTAGEIRTMILDQHYKQVKRIVESLKAEPEGDGNMFDNTMIMYFPEAGEKHHGQGHPPFFVLSGKNCNLDMAGRYIRFPKHGVEGHQTVGNWYTTLLNAHGNPIKHYGNLDSGMTAKKLKQTGPIQLLKRLIRIKYELKKGCVYD